MKSNKNPPDPNKLPPAPRKPSPMDAAIEAMQPMVQSAQIAFQQQISGPLPPPEMLRQYELIQSGLVNRIISMAEAEAAHRRTIETTAIAIQDREQRDYRRTEVLWPVDGILHRNRGCRRRSGVRARGASGRRFGIAGGAAVSLVAAFIGGRHYLAKSRQQDIDRQIKSQGEKSPETTTSEKGMQPQSKL